MNPNSFRNFLFRDCPIFNIFLAKMKGNGLSAEASASLDKFIGELAGGLDLWTGPINLQDGTGYLADGETATDQQIWYLPQLLEGMEGQSVSQ